MKVFLVIFTVLVITELALADVEGTCHDGWDLLGDYCYTFIPTKMKHADAKTTCRKKGGILAEPRSQTENENIYNYAQPKIDKVSRWLWIGIERYNKKEVFKWSSNEELLSDYASWHAGQPNNNKKRQNCVELIVKVDRTFNETEKWNDDECSHIREFVCQYTPDPDSFRPGQCGKRIVEHNLVERSANNMTSMGRHSSKIVGGHQAYHGEFPWQARVTGPFLCGAAIINNYWLLSATHCFMYRGTVNPVPKEYFNVVVGDHSKRYQDSGEQKFEIDQLIRHEHYTLHFENDIALIKIKPVSGKGIQFNNYVQPACLPERDVYLEDGLQCLISGWGATKRGPIPDILRGTSVPVMSQEKCRNYYYDNKFGGKFDDGMMCAGYEEGGKDTCQGDSGGPFVCRVGGLYTLYGLTSFGKGCAEPNRPGYYARVAHYLSWIKDKMDA